MRPLYFLPVFALALAACQTGTPSGVTVRSPTTLERSAIKQAILSQARNPSSVSSIQIATVHEGSWGKEVCVRFNSQNGLGGYTGVIPYYARFNGGWYIDRAVSYCSDPNIGWTSL